ncbi:glycosyltransferase [Isoptericola sp. b441]|uniref:Glycosyltransferase n=1 Tax=Actinotalea lenta TaxID=3064654 RepID=A0ABT9DCE6_9CELL|nr:MULTISPECIES: glycosyltransferase [unclassified Isoptericola]MDO8108562.1 glycosyltransferase [Isoptericola sp. b441]MDO8119972.1 glycosyltransferase [Isoptericola sp. b490]
MKLALVGPTHPFKGGIAQHTTRLAGALRDAGVSTALVSWSRQYPARLYPGQLTVPDGQPEVPPYDRTTRDLAWNRPDSWLRVARRLRAADAVVFVVVTPLQLVAYHVMLSVLGRGTRTVALVHNVLPHEPSPVDRPLVSAFLRRVDAVLVHTTEQAELARELGAADPVTILLPSNIEAHPHRAAPARTSPDDPLEVLFFGLVRPYKGVDVLVRAAAEVPQVRLTVAGEFWSDPAELASLAHELGAGDRVSLRAGYVPTEQLEELFGASHVVALPYRDATGSGNIRLALEQGVPVVVTRVGDLPESVAGGLGLVCEPDDVASLAEALRSVADPEVQAALDRAVAARPSSHAEEWSRYVGALVDLAEP